MRRRQEERTKRRRKMRRRRRKEDKERKIKEKIMRSALTVISVGVGLCVCGVPEVHHRRIIQNNFEPFIKTSRKYETTWTDPPVRRGSRRRKRTRRRRSRSNAWPP